MLHFQDQFLSILAKFQFQWLKFKKKIVLETPVLSQKISSGDPTCTFENLVAHTYMYPNFCRLFPRGVSVGCAMFVCMCRWVGGDGGHVFYWHWSLWILALAGPIFCSCMMYPVLEILKYWYYYFHYFFLELSLFFNHPLFLLLPLVILYI